eukprot:TRINITY_DN44151_c0_g1_i1.p1 TRINITY_DN44151_c0_g1~~TRINITY_DN44151_c0_g1_i1.p1  ORF type:complete len:317 (+),score=96.55 TRINITY_DN44151_c0_g1_i1:32-982(+)
MDKPSSSSAEKALPVPEEGEAEKEAAGDEHTATLEQEDEDNAEAKEQQHEEGSDDEDLKDKDKTKKKKKKIVCPDGSIWIIMENPKAPEKFRRKKILVSKDTSITDLRKMTCIKVGCPFREMLLEIDGKSVWEGRLQPFIEETEKERRVRWRKTKRLAKFVEEKKTGGVNGKSGRYGRTVLHYTTIMGDYELCEEVLNHPDVDPEELVNVSDMLEDTALTLASILGFSDIVSLCLDAGADIEKQNLKGRTPMLLAAEHGHQDVVQTLLIANASIGPVPGTKRPDAMYLAELNQRDAVRFTIKQYIRNQQGESLLDF